MRKKYAIDESLTGPERVRARHRAAYLANRESAILAAAAYRLENKEKVAAARKLYRDKNKEKIAADYSDWKGKNKDSLDAYRSEYRAKNAELIKEKKRTAYAKNRERVLEKQKAYAQNNKEKINAYHRNRYAEIPEAYKAKEKRRRALKINAQAKWDVELTEFVCCEASKLVKLRLSATGIKWHMDHVVPLRGKFVSGLHVWNNFRVIPAQMNLEKGNRYE